MSGYVTGWVLKHSEAEGAARMVLVVLADHASSDGTDSFPTVDTIQHEARLKSRRSVQLALRWLEDAGAITAAGKGSNGQTNWTVLMPHEGGRIECAPGASDDTGGRNLRQGGGAFNAPKPSLLTVLEPSEGVSGSPGDEIERVWDHYVEVMGPRSRELDPAARAVIRDALKVASLNECLRAIDGCKASAFHMGENDRGKKYNRLTQILKGKRGIRTTREQIDLFVDVAERNGIGASNPSVDPARLAQAKQNVLAAWEMPGSEQARKNGEMSAAWLAQHGYRVVPDPVTGRPTFEREQS